jgi:hypothetical protein
LKTAIIFIYKGERLERFIKGTTINDISRRFEPETLMYLASSREYHAYPVLLGMHLLLNNVSHEYAIREIALPIRPKIAAGVLILMPDKT